MQQSHIKSILLNPTNNSSMRLSIPPSTTSNVGQLKIFIKGLKKKTSPDEVFAAFSCHGTILRLKVPYSKSKEKNMGYGFVEFLDREDAIRLLKNVSSILVDGKDIDISIYTKNGKPKSTNEEEESPSVRFDSENKESSHLNEKVQEEQVKESNTSHSMISKLAKKISDPSKPGSNNLTKSKDQDTISDNLRSEEDHINDHKPNSIGKQIGYHIFDHSIRPTSSLYKHTINKENRDNYKMNQRKVKVNVRPLGLTKLGGLGSSLAFKNERKSGNLHLSHMIHLYSL